MTQQAEKKIHWSFWTISIIALIWNLMGVANLSMQFIAPESSSFPEWWREVIVNRPIWSTAAMVLALICAVFGCVLLFLKRAEAVFLFIASLVGILLTVSHAATVGDPGLPRYSKVSCCLSSWLYF